MLLNPTNQPGVLKIRSHFLRYEFAELTHLRIILSNFKNAKTSSSTFENCSLVHQARRNKTVFETHSCPILLDHRTTRIKLRPSTRTIAYQPYVLAKKFTATHIDTKTISLLRFQIYPRIKLLNFYSTRVNCVIFINISPLHLSMSNSIPISWLGLVGRVYANGPGDQGSIQGRVKQKT